jgi:hypothetical protein
MSVGNARENNTQYCCATKTMPKAAFLCGVNAGTIYLRRRDL